MYGVSIYLHACMERILCTYAGLYVMVDGISGRIPKGNTGKGWVTESRQSGRVAEETFNFLDNIP